MKKILFFILIAQFLTAQSPDLLNTDWRIVKIENEFLPVKYPPPMPYQQVTKFSTSTPQLNSSFFNIVSANLIFIGQDRFTLSNKNCTIANYTGDNGEVNQFFALICDFFDSNTNFYYNIYNNGTEKTLTIFTPIFETLYFTSTNLGTNDNKMSQFILSPNPVKSHLTIENKNGINAFSIFDLSGKLVYEQKNVNAKSLNFDMQNFKVGSYFIKINNEETFKILKK